MATNLDFDLEDKLSWDELSPSLQDKFKMLWNQIEGSSSWLDDRMGDIRITIGRKAPDDPVEYCELWFDTRYMVFRTYDGTTEWPLMTAAWYGNSADTVESSPEASLSLNPVTNCHCYTVNWGDSSMCHCKSQVWDPTSVPTGTKSDIAFNEAIATTVTTTRYNWNINAQMDGVIVQSLNAYTAEEPNANAIIPYGYTTRVANESGQSVPYVSVAEEYDTIFDDNSSTVHVFNLGVTNIPFEFANNITLSGIFGRLAPYSNGPVTITLQAYTSGSYQSIASITLAGNPQYAIQCHGNCHCARW